MKRISCRYYWCKVFGLGFAFETFTNVVDDENRRRYRVLPIHLYLGALFVCVDINFKSAYGPHD